MSNGTVCCAVGACCDHRPQRDRALAKEIAGAMGWDEDSAGEGGRALAVAKAVLDRFDLVPLGLGGAIVAAYKPFFQEALKGAG